MIPAYQHVDLIFDPARQALALKLPEQAKRINPCLRGLFSDLTQDVSGNLQQIQSVVARIRETPSYKKLVDTVNVKVKTEIGEIELKPTTVANLEIYIVFASALKIKNGHRLFAKGLRIIFGLEPHLESLHRSLIVPHDLDCALIVAQIRNLSGFLPRIFRWLLGLQDLEEVLDKLYRRRTWQNDRQIPTLFKDQFPTVEIKNKTKIIQATDSGSGGHNMLNPKRTQEPKPKDDTTPLKTRPGRDK
ncbi:MAG: hypothetical protein U1E78_04160 [Gammaproteobacteria bacterium]